MKKFRIWSKREVYRLIRCVDTLKLEIPPVTSDPQWRNIDKFLKKPAGSSARRFKNLMKRYSEESKMIFPSWRYFNPMKQILGQIQPDFDNIEPLPESSATGNFDFKSVSVCSFPRCFPNDQNLENNNDQLFLQQLLSDLKKLDCKTKSSFKLQTQKLLHQLIYD